MNKEMKEGRNGDGLRIKIEDEKKESEELGIIEEMIIEIEELVLKEELKIEKGMKESEESMKIKKGEELSKKFINEILKINN